MRYLVLTEEAYRQKFAPAFLSDLDAAAYKELCTTLTEPYKNVVRFDGGPLNFENLLAATMYLSQHWKELGV